MKILMIAQRLPYPPDKGEKIRSYHELKYLAQRYDVWCACLIDDPADWAHVDAVRELCRDVAVVPQPRALGALRAIGSVLFGGTITEGYFRSTALQAAIARWSAHVQFDAVLAFSSSVARYGLAVAARRRVVDLCDVDSAKWASYATRRHWPVRWLFGTEAKRLARHEWELAAAFDAATVISEREAERFRNAQAETAESSPPPVTVFCNGIDLDAFTPSADPAPDPIVGFVGTMDYPPNTEAVCWFADRVWPRVRQDQPAARFRIVGRSPTRRVRSLRHRPGIDVTGAVPKIQDELQRMQVCVVPIQMVHGLQNKVLEAMACGKPVVATRAVAASAGAEPGRDLLVGDDEASFAAEVATLLSDADRRQRVGAAARSFVETRFRWEDQLAVLERLLCGGEEGVASGK